MMKKIVSVSFLLLCVLLVYACEKQGEALDPNESALQNGNENPMLFSSWQMTWGGAI